MNVEERIGMIEEYGRGFDLFASALADIPHEVWEFKPAPGEWSVHEVIVHMADSECEGAMRVRKLIAEPGGTLMVYDDAKWAVSLHYQDQNLDDALQLFRLARLTTYRLLQLSSDRIDTHSVIHPEAVYPEYDERYTLEKWLNIYTRHTRDHIGQLKQIHQAWEARKPRSTVRPDSK